MATFNYDKFISAEPRHAHVLNGNEFEVIAGSTRKHCADIMDYEAIKVLKKAKFRLNKEKCSCDVISYDKSAPAYMTDIEEMLTRIVIRQSPKFFQHYDFSPKGFTQFARTLLRPISLSICSGCKKDREKQLAKHSN